jgi:drug/metabolite transporter (DMT)-like permease
VTGELPTKGKDLPLAPSARTAHMAGVWLAILSAVGFSFKAILIKLAYAYPQPVPVDAVTLLTLRMLFALPFFAWTAWRGRLKASSLTAGDWGYILLLGFLGYYGASIFDFMGLHYISAGLERLILFTYPTLTLLIAVLFYGKKIVRPEVIALLLCYAGIILAFTHDLKVAADPRAVAVGGGLVFASSFCYAIYIAGSGRVMVRLGSMWISSLALLAAIAATVVQFGATHQWSQLVQPAPIYWLSAAMGVFSTVIPVFALAAAIRLIGGSSAALVSSLGPILTIFCSWWILSEDLSLAQIAGAVLVTAGVLQVGRQRAR